MLDSLEKPQLSERGEPRSSRSVRLRMTRLLSPPELHSDPDALKPIGAIAHDTNLLNSRNYRSEVNLAQVDDLHGRLCRRQCRNYRSEVNLAQVSEPITGRAYLHLPQ